MRRRETVLARIGELPPNTSAGGPRVTLAGEAIFTMKDVCRLDTSRPSPS
jgi:hypothetical protein